MIQSVGSGKLNAEVLLATTPEYRTIRKARREGAGRLSRDRPGSR